MSVILSRLTRYTKPQLQNEPSSGLFRKKIKAAPRFELGMEVLQTSALPLGYAAASPPAQKSWESNPSLPHSPLSM
jgi:hypothetical protein